MDILKENQELRDAIISRTKELENSNRELALEAALERVRARTMAMQHSYELQDAAFLMFEQIKKLGVSVFGCGFNIWDKDRKASTAWMAGDNRIQPSFKTSSSKDIFVQIYEAATRGDSLFVEEQEGKSLQKHYKYMVSIPEFKDIVAKMSENGYSLPDAQIMHCAFFSHGYLMFITFEPVPEAHHIFKRFATVFEQTYTRFLDLKKAEFQAQEAKIEAALERVRSSAMMMLTSDDLKTTVSMVFSELDQLGLKTIRCGIGIFDDHSNKVNVWAASSNSSNKIANLSGDEYLRGHPLLEAIYNNWRLQKDFTYVLKNQDLQEYYKVVSKSNLPLPSPKHNEELRQYYFCAYFPAGGLFAFKNSDFSQNDKLLMKRFSEVFHLSFIRHQDLKKAEAQTREANIQLALERVRARSMAMHSSEELNDVLRVMFQQIEVLGIDAKCAHLTLMDVENNKFSFRITGKSGARNIGEQIIDLDAMPIWKETVENWKKAKPHTHQCLVYPKDMLPDLWELIDESLRSLPANERIKMKDFPNGIFDCEGHTKFGYIGFNNSRPPTEEEISIVILFAREFERVYQRFLDIEKAEAQAKEAQIEAALEKVRSRSLAMQSSSELQDVVQIVAEKIQKLGVVVDPVGVLICTYPEGYKSVVHWTYTPDEERSKSYYLPYFEHPIWDETIASKENGDSYFSKTYTKAIKNKFLKTIFTHPDSDYSTLPEDYKQWQLASPVYTLTFGWGKNSAILLPNNDGTEPNKEQINILIRFASVFEQSYVRFLDLQKAEKQAREAQIQLSLERVRAKSMAMQTSDELHDVLSTLFQQFDVLGIQPVSVFLSLFDKEKRTLTYRASGKSGKRISGQQTVSIDSLEVWTELFDKWKNDNSDEVEVIFYTKEILPTLFELLSETFAAMPRKERMTVDDFPNGGYTMHGYTPFGYLGYNHTREATKEEKNILTRFATEFSRVYQRFLDLQKAEAQAREAQIEAATERIRAKAMAMHQSSELSDVLKVLFDQFDILGIDPVFAHLSLIDLESNTFTYRMTGRGGKRVLTKQVIDLNARDEWKDSVAAFKQGKPNTVSCLHFPKEALPQIWELFHETFGALPKGAKIYQKDFPDGLYNTQGYCKFGYLGFNHNRSATEEEKDIVVRFATEFGRLYQRFLELEKAEAQAREAQIEVALERLRASTMAMKTQGELLNVIEVFGSQLAFLGINIDSLSVIHGVPKRDWDFWIHTPDSGIPPYRVYVPYIDTAYFTKSIKNIEEYERTGNPIHFKSFNKEEKDEFITHFFNCAPSIPQEFKTLAFAHKKSHVIEAFLEEVTVSLHKYGLENFSAEDIKIFTRFSLEFKQTYTRFLDLKKAEEQARQAQIEVSLERVRAKAMAMHHTDELTDVLCVLFDQFDILGINPVLTHLTLFDEENETFSLRITTTAENRIVAEQYIDINAVEAWKDSFENWKKSEPNAVDCIDYEPEIIPMVFDLLSEVMNALPKGHRIYPKDFPDGLYTTQGHFKFGYIGFNHTRRATEEEKSIVERFAREFGRTYQRFLDLQKAEEQAREAQIEAALEKVRSRSLAMHQSTEMQEVANEIRNQLLHLGMEIDALAMSGVIDNESDYDVWVGGANSQKPLRIPYNNDTQVQRDFNKAIKERPDLFTKTYKGKVMKAYFKHLMASNSFNPEIEEFMLNSTAFTTALTFMKNSGIQIIRYNDEPFSDADNTIVKRFGRVFEQAYIRFLDLQKAEKQAREAQIENALEKVRSRTMAMQKSEELPDAANNLFLQLQALGLPAWSAGYCIWQDEKKNASCNMSTEGQIQMSFILPSIGEGYDFYTPSKNGKSFHIHELSGKPLVKHYEFMVTLPVVSEILDGIIKSGFSLPTFQIFHIVYFKYGYVMFITYESMPHAHDIFKRFGKVFEQTYTRFLDLQKAEEQTREAQIEAALERVRSRSLAMRKSDELPEVLSALFEQFNVLQINPVFTILNLYDLENDTFTIRTTGKNGIKVLGQQTVKFSENDIWRYYGEKFKQGNPDIVQNEYYPVEILPDVWNTLKEIVEAVPKKNRPMPSDFPDGLYNLEGYCEFGTIGCNLDRPPTEEEKNIIVKFAKEFGQAYQRFLDIEKSETQIRDAQINLAVERVRAKALAMHQSEEIMEVVVKLKEEVMNLDIPDVVAATIFLREGEDKVRMWDLSTLEKDNDGYQIPFDISFKLKKSDPNLYVKRAWENPENYFLEIQESKDLKRIVSWLQENNKPEIAEEVQGHIKAIKLKRLYHAVKKLNNGKLVVDLLTPPSDEMETILTKMGAAFDLAYKRFEDLQKAEAQAREAQIEAALERVRSRSMAMHKSDELLDVISVVSEQLQHLEFKFVHVSFTNNEIGKDYKFWTSSKGIHKPMRFNVPYLNIAVFSGLKKAQENSIAFYTDIITIEEHVKWHKHLLKHGGSEVFSKEENEFIMSRGMARSIAINPNIMLILANYASIPYSEEDNKIIARFGRVFEQSYTRFLDLKKSEAQTRETEIELALERIRARTMAMHKSSELGEVAAVLFEQISSLTDTPSRFNIAIVNKEDKYFDIWVTDQNGKNVKQQFNFHVDKSPVVKEVFKAWKKNQEYIIQDLHGDKLVEWIRYSSNEVGVPFDLSQVKDHRYITSICFNNGVIGITTDVHPQKEDIQLLERFTKVFEQTYTRFLDLQKAEAQATIAEQNLINLKTEKKRAEDALTELQHTQKQLIQSEKMASLGELTAGIAHEIQNPLNFVNNFSEVSNELIDEMNAEIEKGDLEEAKFIMADIKSNLEKINHHGKRADAIVKGMLQHSRSSTAIKEPTDINKLADEYFRLAYHGLRAKDKSFKATLETTYDTSIGTIPIISQDIGRVILNLITNAFYACNQKKNSGVENYEPTVTVSTKKRKDNITVSVKDNGNGIPKNVLEKIFQPFFTTKPTGQGTGLGLSMSYDIVKVHGGQIKVETKEGEGTTFFLLLPV